MIFQALVLQMVHEQAKIEEGDQWLNEKKISSEYFFLRNRKKGVIN